MRHRGGGTPSRHPSTSSSKLTVASCIPEQELESIQTSSSRVLRIRAARSWVKSLFVCVCRLYLLFVQPPLPAEPRRGSGPIGVRGSRFPSTRRLYVLARCKSIREGVCLPYKYKSCNRFIMGSVTSPQTVLYKHVPLHHFITS